MSRPQPAAAKPTSEPLAEPTPANVTKASVFSVAEDVARQLGYTPRMDLFPIVETLGGAVHPVTMSAWESLDGSIQVHGPQDFDIYIPGYGSPLRNRFTIAHELGHYFLHAKQGLKPLKAARYTANRNDRCEWEANWFAAGFLMPITEMKKAIKRFGKDEYAVAFHFGVSADAARIRLESF